VLNLGIRRRRPVRWHAQLQRWIYAGRFVDRSGLDDLRLQSVQVEMRGPRCAGHRRAPGMAQQSRQVGGAVHLGVELRHRRI